MSKPAISNPAMRRRLPLHVASLWIALLTALLSSLMFGGVPRTTALGSAFNPATTAVALQPSRAQPRILVEAVRGDDGPASGQGDAAAIASALTAPAAPPPAVYLAPQPFASASLPPPTPVLDGSPRGPPFP